MVGFRWTFHLNGHKRGRGTINMRVPKLISSVAATKGCEHVCKNFAESFKWVGVISYGNPMRSRVIDFCAMKRR